MADGGAGVAATSGRVRVRSYPPRARHPVEAEPTDIDRLLDRGDGSVLWVDVVDPTDDDVALLADEFRVHHLAAEDLRSGGQRTKHERWGDHWLIVVKDPSLADASALALAEVDLVVGDGWLVTVRRRSDAGTVLSADEIVDRYDHLRRDERGGSVGDLLYVVLDTVVDHALDVVDLLDDRIDDVETLAFDVSTPGPVLQRRLFDLRRTTGRIRRAVGPLREITGALARGEVPAVEPSARLHLQDVHDHVLRVLDRTDAQRELLAALLEARLAVVGNNMNRVMKTMTSWGAILFAASLIAGVYGMNFEDIPGAGLAWGFWLAIGVMAVMTAGLWLVFRRHDWL